MFDLVALAKAGLSVHSAATGGAFKAALDAIAVVEMEAARQAFSSVEHSAQPREALNRTLTHLETAHVALRNYWVSTISRATRVVKSEAQAEWDARVCCLIAYIHRVLGDDDRLVLKALQAAEEARHPPKETYVEWFVGGLFFPVAVTDILTDDRDFAKRPIPEHEFRKFSEVLMARSVPHNEPGLGRCPNPACRSRRGWDGTVCRFCGNRAEPGAPAEVGS